MMDLLIDLDNTVYSESDAIFAQVDLKMKRFIAAELKVDYQKAYKIQKKYFKENGTTLRGLMLHHNIKPKPFLDYVHDIDLSAIKENLILRNLLRNYSGKKIIFTNGTFRHAENVLKKVGIYEYIDNIFDIVEAQYIPKPEKITYEKVIEKYKLFPSNTIMLDDIPSNLLTAYKLGIKTILIKNKNQQKYDYIDYISCDISEVINKLINGDIFK